MNFKKNSLIALSLLAGIGSAFAEGEGFDAATAVGTVTTTIGTIGTAIGGLLGAAFLVAVAVVTYRFVVSHMRGGAKA